MLHKDPEKRKDWQKQYNEKRLLENPSYRKDIQKKYRERNKEKMREYQKKHYQENRTQISARLKESRKLHPEKFREKQHRYYQKYKDAINAKHRANYHANPEKSKEQKRKSRLKHRDQINLRIKTRRKNEKYEVMSVYSKGQPKCACCNESIFEFLTLDHIEGRKKIDHGRKFAGKDLYKWAKENNYPSVLQVLCMNCNFAKGLFGKCPHQSSTER